LQKKTIIVLQLKFTSSLLIKKVHVLPAPAGAAPTPDPMLVINSLTFIPSKALAKSPGQ